MPDPQLVYEFYRCYHRDGTPWKDWAVAIDETKQCLIVWWGTSNQPMQSRRVDQGSSLVACRNRRVQGKLDEGYRHEGQVHIVNRQVQAVPAGVDPVDALQPDTGAIKLYWTLGRSKYNSIKELNRLADLLADQIESRETGEHHLRLTFRGHEPWEFNITPDGLHNQGSVAAVQGPYAVLLLLRLAKANPALKLAQGNGTDVIPGQIRGDLPHLQFDGVAFDDLVETAEKLGLTMSRAWAYDLGTPDVWI
jgi:hypothetical protein